MQLSLSHEVISGYISPASSCHSCWGSGGLGRVCYPNNDDPACERQKTTLSDSEMDRRMLLENQQIGGRRCLCKSGAFKSILRDPGLQTASGNNRLPVVRGRYMNIFV